MHSGYLATESSLDTSCCLGSLKNSGIDLFTDTAAILISIVSNSYYGMPRGQIHINLPPEHPIMSFETIEIKMAAVSVKSSITVKGCARHSGLKSQSANISSGMRFKGARSRNFRQFQH